MRPVWTDGTGTGIFIPFARLAENEVASARISLLLQRNANIEVVPATRGSKDGWTYPDAPAIWASQAYTSTTGWTWGGSYAAPDDDYQFIEFGFLVRNTTGAAKNCAMLTMILDIRK
jgi:hypothetical protein